VQPTLIVDKEIGDAAVDGIFKTIQGALNKAPPGAIIKVSPGVYDEHLRIK
jgi:hypothetical protein